LKPSATLRDFLQRYTDSAQTPQIPTRIAQKCLFEFPGCTLSEFAARSKSLSHSHPESYEIRPASLAVVTLDPRQDFEAIKIRLVYVAMSGVWFPVGNLKQLVTKKNMGGRPAFRFRALCFSLIGILYG
jgi:hypothetical protein